MRSAIVALAALLCSAFASAEIVRGRDYELLPVAQSTASADKVEVLEFFSYACPHCANFHPHVTRWAKALPSDVEFVRIPVVFGRRPWGQLVRAYYALQASGQLERFDDALFDAIHKEGRSLFDEPTLTAWVAERGGNAAAFREAFYSDEVTRKALRANELTRVYRVQGVPHLAVAGKYSVKGETQAQMLEIATALVERERAAKRGTGTE